ncbi:hypothetical protein I4U23_029952 [Adineta vaga]|nr:hypothetical protein I4U23_029952 [Adineta vaga]
MPYKCCTCKEQVDEVIKPIILDELCNSIKLNDLIKKINREKELDAKLLLSMNRFQKLVVENLPKVVVDKSLESQDSVVEESENKPKRIVLDSSSNSDSSSSESEDITPMDTSKFVVVYSRGKSLSHSERRGKTKVKKPPKSIKSGTFMFLPYIFKDKKAKRNQDPLIEVAKSLQRSRFINKNGHFHVLEDQYNARINMITKKTSKQIIGALESAKQGLENLKIYNKKETLEISAKEDGEWILVRSKKQPSQTNTNNIDDLLEEITNRWMSTLTIEKRKCNDDDEDDSTSKKKK